MATYQVRTEDDLFAIRNDINGTYVLQNDIRLTKWQTGSGWTPIPEFRGVIDGNGFKIHDLYINNSSEGVGFIKYLYAGEIKNVHFANVNILGGTRTGAIASWAKGIASTPYNEYQTYYGIAKSAKINNVKVDGSIRSSSENLGGLVGATDTDVSPSRWDDSPMINLDVADTHINLQIYGFSNNIGGMVGLATGGIKIQRSSTRGNIHNGNYNIGGLIGSVPYYRGQMTDSYSLMSVQGNNYVGGLAGIFTTGHYTNQIMKNTYFAGTLVYPKDRSNFVGGAVGYGAYSEGTTLIDYEKLGFRHTATYINKSLDTINERQNVKEYTTAEMAKLETYYRNGFQIYGTWFDDLTSSTDTVQLRSELPSAMITLDGVGTLEDPFLVRDIYDLIALDEYDARNWSEYFNKIINEYNNPAHINFKDNYKMPQPTRWHYKMVADIEVGVFPFNQEGWLPLSKQLTVDLDKQNWYGYYNSIGERIGRINDAGQIDTVNKNGQFFRKGFMGVLDGNGFKVKNLTLKEIPNVTPNETNTYIGLFDTITGGTVRNLTFENLRIDFDFYRDENVKGNSYVGTVASRLQGTSTLDRITVKGESLLKDYRADVGGAKVFASGLVHQVVRLDDSENVDAQKQPDYLGFSGSRRKSNITNSSVQIKNTYLNVLTGDEHNHFTPFVHAVSYVNIQDCYSACSNTARDTRGLPLGGTHGNQVFIGTIGKNVVTEYLPVGHPDNNNNYAGLSRIVSSEANGIVTRCYYDSDIVNAESSPTEVYNAGWVEIFGRTTNAMRLQATYVGWDFARTWDTDGVNYPIYKPYDANYVPPTNAVIVSVNAYIDAPYMWVDSNGVHRKLRKVTVKATSKKFLGNTTEKKKGTTHMNTQVQPLYSIAFKYEAPVFHNAIAETEIIELNCHAQAFSKTKKANNLLTSIDSINTSATATGVNKGIFFGSIEVVTIGVNSMLIRVNDKRIKRLEFMSGLYDVVGKSYVTIAVEPKAVATGVGIFSINALDENGSTLVSKSIRIAKQIIPFKNKTNRTLVVNGEKFKITNHTSDGVMTLDKNFTTRISKVLSDGQHNAVELVEYDLTPKLSIGKRGSDLQTVTGTLVNTKKIGNEVEEEYEFVGEGNMAKAQIEFARELPATNATGGNNNLANGIKLYQGNFVYTGNAINDDPYNAKGTLTNMGVMNLDGTLTQHFSGMQDDMIYQLIEIDVEDFVKKNINETYVHSANKNVSVTLKWNGYKRIKTYSQQHVGTESAVNDIKVWNNSTRKWDTVANTTASHAQSKYVTTVSVTGNKYTFTGVNPAQNTRSGGNVYFLVQMPRIDYASGTTTDVDTTSIFTDYVEVTVNAPDQNNEIAVLNSVKQVFIPKDQTTTL